MKKALYCGSFDPFTMGHFAVIKKALSQEYGFEKIIVVVSNNPDKKTLFSTQERVEMIKKAMQSSPINSQIEVISHNGLTVDLARQLGINNLIRGLRIPEIDLIHEEQLSQTTNTSTMSFANTLS